jgi:hypothetical protein
MKIALQKTDSYSRESLTIIDICLKNSIPIRSCLYGSDVYKSEIPVGTVEFVESALDKFLKPDYHPDWLKEFVIRKTWISKDLPKTENVIFKPNDRYKLFDATTIEFMKDSLNGSEEFFCQELVDVSNEWRIYVSDGKIWNCSWYRGPVEDKEVNPDILEKISNKIPEKWCGTIDMMETNNGIELCECHHPYAIGWYGNSCENEKYFDFIINGYDYLKEL